MDGEVTAGSRVGGYRIERLLGRGGMGSVFLAVDEALERRVALKLLDPALARDERFTRRFLLESKLAARLDHPAIVPVFAAGETEGRLFIAMRYVPGGTLEDRIETRGRLDGGEATALLAMVASALDVAHDEGLVHRDVKPGNILVEGDRALLCDFGLARGAASIDSLSREHGLTGTLAYVAPEQIEGDTVTGRADQYALACVLFEALTGRTPFLRDTEIAAIYAHLSDPPPSAVEQRADLPWAIDGVLARALAKDPAERYATCGEFIAQARAALTEAPLAISAASSSEAPVRAPRAFVAAGVRGYEAYTERHGGEAAAELVKRFANVVANITARHHGLVVDARGGEATMVFDTAADALRAALALQGAGADLALGDGLAIGVDAGEAVASDGAFLGDAINRAAALCAAASAGQTLTTASVQHAVGHLDGVSLHDLGTRRVKGVTEPVAIRLVTTPEAAAPRRPRSKRAPLTVAGALLVALVVAGGFLLLRGGGHAEGGSAAVTTANAATGAPPSSITWYDPASLRKTRTTRLPAPAAFGTFGGQYLWLPDSVDGTTVTRVDRTTGESRAIATPGRAGPILAGSDGLWWGSADGPKVALIDAATGVVAKRATLPTKSLGFYPGPGHTGIGSIALDDRAAYVAYGQPGVVARLDRQTLKVEKVFTQQWGASHCCEVLVVVDGGALWVIDRWAGGFERIDKRTGAVLAQGELHGGWVEDATVAGDYLWVPIENDRGAWKVDRDGKVVGLVPTGGLPWAISAGAGAVWVTNKNDETVTRIDPVSGDVRQLKVGNSPNWAGIDPDGKLLVLTDQPVADPLAGLTGKRVVRLLVTGDPTLPPDPATAFGTNTTVGWAVQKAVGLNLTRIADDPNPHVVVDGAKSYAVSPDGLTYTFTIRSGLRFSPPSGKPITAETFRAGIERSMNAGFQTDTEQSAFNYLQEVDGAQAFHDGKADHVAGLSASGDTLTIRLTRPDGALPAILSQIMYQAVPDGTVVVPNGLQGFLPSGGPYYVARYAFDRYLVLRPNPNYHGDRKTALDAIVLDMAWSEDLGVAQVIAGKADAFASPDQLLNPGRSIATTYAAPAPGKPRWLFGAGAAMSFLQFNTTRPAFRDPRVRLAVSKALDRAAWAKVSGGAPFDSILIPGSPGYRSHPIPGPDRSEITRLLAGRHPQISFYHDPGAHPANVGETVRQLEQMGFRVHEKGVATPTLDARQTADRPGEPWDIRLDHWSLDFPDIGLTVNDLVLPEEQPFRWGMPRAFRNAEWNDLVRRATRLTGEERDRTYEGLATRLLAEQAPIAVLASGPEPIFAGPRLGCIVPVRDWVDLEQLCLNR